MKKSKSSYGLILSSIVAVVALVGMVMLFGSAKTGALTNPGLDCSGYWDNVQIATEDGYLTTGQVCVPRKFGKGGFEKRPSEAEWRSTEILDSGDRFEKQKPDPRWTSKVDWQ